MTATTTHPAAALSAGADMSAVTSATTGGEQLADLSAPSTGEFLAALAPFADRALVFQYAGRRILPGYHVTEVTAATFSSMDCGGRPDQWQETIVQLWDVPGDAGGAHMSVAKFLGIYRKVAAAVPVSDDAGLTIEWGDDVSPALRHRPLRLRADGDTAVVLEVGAVQATCKPRDDRYAADGVDKPTLTLTTTGAPLQLAPRSGTASSSCCAPAAGSAAGPAAAATGSSAGGSCCG